MGWIAEDDFGGMYAIRTSLAVAAMFLFTASAQGKYAGGSGTADVPYEIRTAEQIMALGAEPDDWDKHFILTDNIDLNPSLPDRKVFDRAIIAFDTDSAKDYFQGTAFTGVFDGNGHTIFHMTITGKDYLGLFGRLGSGAKISNLDLEAVDVKGTGRHVGGLAGTTYNGGSISNSHSAGAVSGDMNVGGLVGYNYFGSIITSYSAGAVEGVNSVGGLVGNHNGTSISTSYSTATVEGANDVGGLVGRTVNGASISNSYSTGSVSGNENVGGLVGRNDMTIVSNSYSAGPVSGDRSVGGLVGSNDGSVTSSVWDTEVSGQILSAGGVGLTTAEMTDPVIYAFNGWGANPNWVQDAGNDYPRLAWEGTPGQPIPEPTMQWLEGLGTREDPYRIENAHQLVVIGEVRLLWDKHFELMADIDLADVNNFTAVIPEFAGTLDGNNHTISHLTITGGGTLGLFGRLVFGAEVYDLGLVDADVAGTGDQIGGLAGENRGIVTRCYSTGTVLGDDIIGGLVGSNEGSVTYSYSTGTVFGDDIIGGLVGSNEGSVAYSYSVGSASGDDRIGGLVGSNSGNVTRCYSAGSVSGDYVGGLVGSNSGSVTNGIWDIETSGQVQSEGGLGLTTSELMEAEMCGLNGWAADPNWVLDFGNDYPRLAWEGTSGQLIPEPTMDWLAGAGTKEDPYEFTDVDQLALVARASILWDDHMELAQDIDFAGRTWSTAVIPEFSGTFIGNGYVIRNLTISGESDLGLFGELHGSARIRYLGIADADVSGTGENIGILAGINKGSVIGCCSTGNVSGDWCVGGLIGNSSGDVVACDSAGTITGSSSVGGLVGNNAGGVANSYSASVVSGDSSVGGLAGKSGTQVSGGQRWGWSSPAGGSASIVVNCYSAGSVSGGDVVGGLVGSNNSGHISNCYSTGPVLGDRCAGGLVGENSGDVLNCYSVGTVSSNSVGAESVGGLVGQDSISFSVFHDESFSIYGTVITSFWDMETETSASMESDAGDGLTTAQMRNIQTFLDAGWDFAGRSDDGIHEIWQMPDEGGYPVLSIFEGYEPPSLLGKGTSENPYLISTAGQLGAILHNDTKSHYKLTTDLDLSGITWSMAVIPRFAGNFDGGGFVVRDLTISGGDNIGLFGQIASGAEVHDLGILNADVTGGTHVGALAGLVDHSIVSNCYSAGNISGSLSTGGLIGFTTVGIVADCQSAATVSGELNSGGLVGYILDGDVVDCHSIGSVSGVDYVGGLVGDNSGNVSNCYSSSAASGANEVGGLVGVNNSNISRCYSTGTVSGNDYVGGLTGQNGDNVDNCYSTGEVLGNADIGGLVGNNRGSVANCYSTGTVSGNANVGGLAGSNDDQIMNCFWDVDISGLSISSGGEGLHTAAMQNVLVYLDYGWDFVGKTENGTEDIWFIEGQDYPWLSWEYEQ